MSVLNGKKVLLGITAGIAAYKTASLVRLFIKLLLFTKKRMKMNCGIIM